MIEGNYQFNIWKEDGHYNAQCVCPDGYNGFTCGKTEAEIFAMIADWYLCVYDIEIPKWKRIIIKLFHL